MVLALVLLLVASGYAAGRVHAEIGYRAGYRLGYRQGYADAGRFRPAGKDPLATVRVTGGGIEERSEASEIRQMPVVAGVTVQKVRHGRG